MNSSSSLRYEWLSQLKKSELKLLCENREIDFETSSKKALIKSILEYDEDEYEGEEVKYENLSKPKLLIELKSKLIKIANYDYDSKQNQQNKRIPVAKKELVKLLNDNAENDDHIMTTSSLSLLNLDELNTLCGVRKIKINDYNSKEKLIQLLESQNCNDPHYTDSMTIKHLTAEMKGRGLKFSRMKKEQMIDVLNSGINYEKQKLISLINTKNVDDLIENTKSSLIDFIHYIKHNPDLLRKTTKNELKREKKQKKQKKAAKNKKDAISKKKEEQRDYLNTTEWFAMEKKLRDARDEIIDIRTMVEGYIDTDFGRDEDIKLDYENPINYDNDSEIDAPDEDAQSLYVVYEDDEELLMNQDVNAIIDVFDDEEEAEEHTNALCADDDNDEDVQYSVQELILNDKNGANA